MGLKKRLFRYHFPEIVAASAFRRIPSTSGVVLMYHEVLPDDITLPAWTIVRESDFLWQMSYLRSHFDVLSMDQAINRVIENNVSKRPFAVVTFDDGYAGNLNTVLPIMKSLELPFIVYVATKAIIDSKLYWYDQIINLLSEQRDVHISIEFNDKIEQFVIRQKVSDNTRWKEVQRLLNRLKQLRPEDRDKIVSNITGEYNSGCSVLEMLTSCDLKRLADSECVTIGSHTHRHELLDTLESGEIRDTLLIAHKYITSITGRQPRHFAYPNGNFNHIVLKHVQEAGYKTAVTTSPGYWTSHNRQLEIPRFGVGRFDSKGQFKAMLSGYL